MPQLDLVGETIVLNLETCSDRHSGKNATRLRMPVLSKMFEKAKTTPLTALHREGLLINWL